MNQSGGLIFANANKKSPKHPDFKGVINVEGKDYEISLWDKPGKHKNYFSAAVREKQITEHEKKINELNAQYQY